MSKPVILTGLRANDNLHLGNYLGAILPIINLQKAHAGQYQINMFIPDLHSFTTPVDHGTLYSQAINNLIVFVAAGLNFNNNCTYIYRQSFVSAHSELAWILSCFTYFGELSRMTQFKDKSTQLQSRSNGPKSESSISAGLFNYPVLMAADILMYDAEYVPLGDDQRQHLELTRDLAIRMNNKFGKLFLVPHDWKKQLRLSHQDRGIRIRSLRNPEKKMSKSVDDPAGTISLTDNPEDAANKVMSATTDSVGVIHYDWEKQPGVTNLLQMLALISTTDQAEINKHWDGKTSYTHLKTEVALQLKNLLSGLQAKLSKVNVKDIELKLKSDEAAVNLVANKKLELVQQKVGLRP